MPEENKNFDIEPASGSQNRIENLKRILMTTKDIDKVRPNKVHSLTKKAISAPMDWSRDKVESTKRKLKHPTFFKKFFWVSFFVMLLSVVFAYFYLSNGGNLVSSKKIDLEVLGNSFVSGGENAIFDIVIVNKNSVNLELASLLVKYDKGVGTKVPASDRIQIGSILSGETKRLPYELPIIGQEGDIKDIVFDLEYHVPGSNALFVKTINTQITLRTSILDINIDAPNFSGPNQPFSIKLSLDPNGASTLKNMALRVEYPTGFTYKGASIEPFSHNNLWYFGDISNLTDQTVTINGQITGFTDEERVFRIYAGELDKSTNDISPIYVSKIRSVILNNPFLSAKINETEDIVPIQTAKSVPVVISWQNNTDSSIRDIEILATLGGPALDLNNVQPSDNGQFYPDQSVIVWDSSTNNSLSLVNSGEAGSVSFSFVPKAPALISSPNKEVSVSLSIRGVPLDSTSEVKEVVSIDSKIYRLGTSVSLDQSALFSAGPLVNIGTLQPKIGQKSSYTVLWVISNTDSLVTGAQVKATLNRNFEWLDESSPISENITYNPSSREIIWNIGSLEKNPAPNIRRQVYFKVGLNPNNSQLGEIPTVFDRSIFFGKDTNTGSQINVTKGSLRLNNVEGSEVRVIK